MPFMVLMAGEVVAKNFESRTKAASWIQGYKFARSGVVKQLQEKTGRKKIFKIQEYYEHR